MYKNVCRHCHVEIECESSKVFANHVRWCKPNDENKNKFLRWCSCLVCKKEMPTQGLKAHLLKHDKENISTGNCLWCDNPIYNNNKFCNHSCAAKSSNVNIDKAKIKRGPSKGWVGPMIPYNILKKRRTEAGKQDKNPSTARLHKPVEIVDEVCKICFKVFQKKSTSVAKCCSKDCRMTVISLNRGRHKKSYLELSFSNWLDSKGIIYKTEVTVKNVKENKWYFVDFMFESLNLIIELDGSQHKDTIESDKIRDEYLRSQGYTVIRITHEEYQSKKRIPEIEKLLGL